MNRKKFLICMVILFGIGCLISIAGENVFFRWLFKLGTMVWIMLFAGTLKSPTKKYKSLIILGLFLSVIGDAFLLLEGEKWFLFGLLAFLTAHLTYIAAFSTRWSRSSDHVSPIIIMILYALLIVINLYRGMAAHETTYFFIPVMFYVVVIAFMSWSAFISCNKHAIIGSLFFIISDSILAWDRFVEPISISGYIIMFTYYTAQVFITLSIEKVNIDN
ncbi:lysoplasmalogenase [Bacillus chungangensis]|uniref:Membrane protein YhhN n=1 Tax=Bacillus chungangensis TaxID=587633 RepID=A0ABT9WWB7_9BACI|nr:lysoplasmalogenase [Bacillus chungangensis]MDQ0177598.1 putative membrane protein YhhN [Bacillus chungangensis]